MRVPSHVYDRPQQQLLVDRLNELDIAVGSAEEIEVWLGPLSAEVMAWIMPFMSARRPDVVTHLRRKWSRYLDDLVRKGMVGYRDGRYVACTHKTRNRRKEVSA